MTDTTKTTATERDAFIAGLGLEYRAEFVPQRLSRNANEKRPSLNWRLTLARNGKVCTVEYTQGIGHIPGHKFLQETVYLRNYHESVADTGKYAPGGPETFGRKPLPAPPLAGVLDSLLSDSEALDYPTYESWGPELGYDADSRAGEAVWHECRRIGAAFRALFTRAERETLANLMRDY